MKPIVDYLDNHLLSFGKPNYEYKENKPTDENFVSLREHKN